MVLIGNKCDLEEKRAVEKLRGLSLAKQRGWLFMETSAKTGHNVNRAIMAIVEVSARIKCYTYHLCT